MTRAIYLNHAPRVHFKFEERRSALTMARILFEVEMETEEETMFTQNTE